MIKNCLLEMTLLGASKETENMLRWETDVQGMRFSLYIYKWRVPNPLPSRIWVDILPRRAVCDDSANLSREDVEADTSLTHEPIVATVQFKEDLVDKVRYCPIATEKMTWEIGEPYIPKAILRDDPERLRIIVMWDSTSRGAFQKESRMPRG